MEEDALVIGHVADAGAYAGAEAYREVIPFEAGSIVEGQLAGDGLHLGEGVEELDGGLFDVGQVGGLAKGGQGGE